MNEQFIDDLRDKIKRGMIGQAEKQYWQGGRVYGYKLVPVLDPAKTDPYGQPETHRDAPGRGPGAGDMGAMDFRTLCRGAVADQDRQRAEPARGFPSRGRVSSALSTHAELEFVGLARRAESRDWLAQQQSVSRGLRLESLAPGERSGDEPPRACRARQERVDRNADAPPPHHRGGPVGAGAHPACRGESGVAALRASHHCRANSTGRDPKYLFSGLLVCGQCGGKFVICEATKYGCSTWRTRGDSVCSNTLRVPRTLIETLLLASIQRDLFTEEGLGCSSRK